MPPQAPKRQSLAAWFHEAITDVDKGPGVKILALVMTHRTSHQTEVELHKYSFGGRTLTPVELETLFMGKARSYAQDLSGVQTFNMLAFYGDPEHPELATEPGARHPFLVGPVGQGDGANGMATEEPTPQGERAQRMRQNEMGFLQSFEHQRHVNALLLQFAQMQAGQVAALTQRCIDQSEIVHDAILREGDRRHAHEMELAKYTRSSAERDRLLRMVPPLANTLTGREIFPIATTDTALIETLIDNFTPEIGEKLASAGLPMPLMAALMDRFAKHEKQKEEIRKAAENMLPAADTGADDAGGGPDPGAMKIRKH